MVVTTRLERGAIVIPEEVRAELGWRDGAEIVAIIEEGGLRLMPVSQSDPEIYTPERRAQFFLNTAVSEEDYSWAVAEVRRMGLDPDTIPHERAAQWAR